jgi:Xaa-Pro dipeptidase
LEHSLRLAGHEGTVRSRSFNLEMHYGSVLAGESAAVSGGTDTPLVGSGPSPAIGMGSSHRPIGRGEPVVVDLCGSASGYLADQTRTFAIAHAGKRLTSAYSRAREILYTVAAEARPGVPASRLYELAHELADGNEGFMGPSGERTVSFIGHGLGLEIDEPPFLARGYDEPLEEGMVFAVEPKFVVSGEGAVGVENTYLVTAGGVEALTTAPDDLIVV